MKTALITGITGQDGILLTRFLIDLDYRVIGLNDVSRQLGDSRFYELFPDIEIKKLNLFNQNDLINFLKEIKPDEIYNLIGLSSVKESYSLPLETFKVNTEFPISLLELVRKTKNLYNTRIFQASSSEMFGISKEEAFSEESQFNPRSPYAVSKVNAHHMCRIYRDAFEVQVSCGILFNHESIYRNKQYVTRKITSGVAEIAAGKRKVITLNSLDIKRDWGHAGDYVKAMWKMNQSAPAQDFVIASGTLHSIREIVQIALKVAGLESEVERYIEIDEGLNRPLENYGTKGNPNLAQSRLGWTPEINFEQMIESLTLHDLKLITN